MTLSLKEESAAVIRTDVLALICPDWRLASFVMDGRTGQITYANTPCLHMLAEKTSVQEIAGRVAFGSPGLTEKFYEALAEMLANGLENAALIDRDGRDGSLMSVMIRNTQGFFREVLERSIGCDRHRSQLVIVELATSRDQAEGNAMRAFALTFSLSPAEAELADLTVRGLSPAEIAAVKGENPTLVRQRLKNVLAKTQCRHPSALVRLIMTVCPPGRQAR